LWKIVVVDC
jgi:hypothetical protein